MSMRLILNEINGVREEEFNGRNYLVAPVSPIKSMRLDQGYVPQEEVKKSQAAWNGTPVTLNHPHDESGNLVSANSPSIAEKTWLGYLFNTEVEKDGEKLKGEVWIDKEHASNLGQENLVEDLKNGGSLSVSTSYFGDKLQAGNYDGEHHDEVMGNLRPDHLALLPNKEGRCSIDDGCFAGAMAANASPPSGDDELRVAEAYNKSVAGVTFEGTETGSLDESEISNDDYESHYLFDADTKSGSSYPVVSAEGNLMRGNVDSAYQLGPRGVTREELYSKLREVNDEFDDPPIDPEDLEMSSNTDDPTNLGEDLKSGMSRILDVLWANFSGPKRPRDEGGRFIEKDVSIDSLQDGDVVQVVKNSGDTMTAVYHKSDDGGVVLQDGETRRIATDSVERVDVARRQEQSINMDRSDYIDYLVENHEFKQESLEGMGDNCLERTYESFNEEEDSSGEGTEQAGNGKDEAYSQLVEAVNELQEEVKEKPSLEDIDERIAANEKEETETQLIDAIVANSQEYSKDELEGTSVSVLKKIKSDVSTGVDYSGQIGGSAHNVDDENAEDWASNSVSGRSDELEADD